MCDSVNVLLANVCSLLHHRMCWHAALTAEKCKSFVRVYHSFHFVAVNVSDIFKPSLVDWVDLFVIYLLYGLYTG